MPEVRLVHSTFLKRMKTGPERHAAQLHAAGIDVLNLHHSEWTGGLTTLFHRFEVLSFGWDAQFDRILDELLDIGIDAVYSDHVDRMQAALERAR
jgi:glycerophosphoryl diester phosphodiesterase